MSETNENKLLDTLIKILVFIFLGALTLIGLVFVAFVILILLYAFSI